ncbi:unnamed protein product [Penicillium egyptiacum]|uniref:Uncharacterized protein n=1 Tax=Penicillium egyptiacum TaxID=1303716 RepID=A0A9W4KHR5_9EURO|nr:unnamed protein product [Penicillium egyptiacum]
MQLDGPVTRVTKTPPRSIQWRTSAEDKLVKWKMIFDDLLGEISVLDLPSSAFKAPRSSDKCCRLSPVKTRSKSTVATFASCTPLEALGLSEFDDSPDGPGSHTPSRRPRGTRFTDFSTLPPSSAATKSRAGSHSNGKSRQYCTKWCLLGLGTRGVLDQKCPNVLDHGDCRHPISQATLIRLLSRQLSGLDPRA